MGVLEHFPICGILAVNFRGIFVWDFLWRGGGGVYIASLVLECILKRNELAMYKDSIYFIYFKLSGGSFPHITTKEYNTILGVFNVVSSMYDKYRPNDRKSF